MHMIRRLQAAFGLAAMGDVTLRKSSLEALEIALGLDADCAIALSGRTRLQKFASNSVVYYQDEPASQVYVLVSGLIRLCYINEDGSVWYCQVVNWF